MQSVLINKVQIQTARRDEKYRRLFPTLAMFHAAAWWVLQSEEGHDLKVKVSHTDLQPTQRGLNLVSTGHFNADNHLAQTRSS